MRIKNKFFERFKSVLFTAVLISCFSLSPIRITHAEEPAEQKPYKATTAEDCPTGTNCGDLPEGTFENWGKDKVYLDALDLNTHSDLDKAFRVIWKWVKKGNSDARLYLTEGVVLGFHLPQKVYDPVSKKSTYDRKEHIRSFNLMALYSINNDLSYEDKEKLVQYAIPAAKEFGFSEDFYICLKKNFSQSCLEGEIKSKKIPSFNQFTKEIDDFYKAGFPAFQMCSLECKFYDENE